MIRQGKLCRNCTDKECRDLGTKQEPIEIECVTCGGVGCENCNQGVVAIIGCPSRACTGVGSVCQLIDLFDKGLPPIAGGALDQSASFLAAVSILHNEESRIKNEP